MRVEAGWRAWWRGLKGVLEELVQWENISVGMEVVVGGVGKMWYDVTDTRTVCTRGRTSKSYIITSTTPPTTSSTTTSSMTHSRLYRRHRSVKQRCIVLISSSVFINRTMSEKTTSTQCAEKHAKCGQYHDQCHRRGVVG